MTKIVTDRVCGLGETIDVHAQFFRRLSSQTNSKILKGWQESLKVYSFSFTLECLIEGAWVGINGEVRKFLKTYKQGGRNKWEGWKLL